ncbi:MAG: hypothetical protein M1829_004278 [Trizodia sp. TS-e1964]|nr:MAG: hypothetical protein M1829_004278 [Trizodia sp. TS-e1964]
MASTAEIPKELPGDAPDDVLFSNIYGLRTVELNRPSKLNSLNGSMARKIIPRLKEWEKSQMANVIVMKGAGQKAFCAGGDVAALAKGIADEPSGRQDAKDYFGLEYRLDHLIATYSKPYVAFMDGFTMGGGVGLSVHAPFRIATERTVFAMPETSIGFFPDVGGSFFLPRLDGELGTYLALTSDRLEGVDAFYAGIATHYIHSASLPDLEARLAELTFKDEADLHQRCKIIDATIEEFVTGLPHKPMKIAGTVRKDIDSCFSHSTVPKILDALEKLGTPWAENVVSILKQRSPTSIAVTLRQMRIGPNWSIAETFQREYLMAGKFMEHPDFVEGVTARLLKKPAEKAIWQPASLEEIFTEGNESGDQVTAPFFLAEGNERLKLLTDTDYQDYPHAWIGLPRESDVERVVKERSSQASPMNRAEITKIFVERHRGKQGVAEKVLEILQRKTHEADGNLVWESKHPI